MTTRGALVQKQLERPSVTQPLRGRSCPLREHVRSGKVEVVCYVLDFGLNHEADGTLAASAGRKFFAANHHGIVFRSVSLVDNAVDACEGSEVARSKDPRSTRRVVIARQAIVAADRG